MVKKAAILIGFVALILGLPLAGIAVSGRSISDFVSFPPLTRPAGHAPFSWPVFTVYLVLAVGILGVIAVAARRRSPKDSPAAAIGTGRFPWWGWAALVSLIAFWVLAWTRLPWFASFQRNTFTPLWLSYIILANALCRRQTGSCPLSVRPGFFLFLFPLSAGFWWSFEYLNQFVHNWYYTGVNYGPLAYSIHASISFATVLPAVYTTRALVANSRWFRRRFHGFPHVPPSWNKLVFSGGLILACLGLVGVGLWPDALFSMLWVAPLLILICLQESMRIPTAFSAAMEGDWRPVLSAAAAALVCGLFWEMWNAYSLAKWMYSIPYIYRFKIFEMPVLGYLGYLPFGLECIAVVEFFDWGLTAGRTE